MPMNLDGFLDEFSKKQDNTRKQQELNLKKTEQIKKSAPKEKKKKKNDFLDDVVSFIKGEKVLNEDINKKNTVNGMYGSTQRVGKVGENEKPGEIDRAVNRFSDPLGVQEQIARKTGDQKTVDAFYSQRKFGEGGGTDLVSDLAGLLAPGGATVKGARMAGLGAKATDAGLKRFVKTGIEGSVVGAGLAGAEVAAREGINPDAYTAEENLKYIGQNAAMGAVLDPSLDGLFRGLNLKGHVNELMKGSVKFDEQSLKNAVEEAYGQKGNPTNVLAPKTAPKADPNDVIANIQKEFKLSTPEQPKTFTEDELNFQKEIFDRRGADEEAFIRSEMQVYDDMLKQSADAELAWNSSHKQAKDLAEKIKKKYGKIYIPEDNWADWGHEIPAQFKAGRGNNSSGIDIYTFADNEGAASVDEAVQFLKKIDEMSKTKLKDLKPVDDMKISPEQYAELEEAARKKFSESETAKGYDQLINDILGPVNPPKSNPVNPPSLSQQIEELNTQNLPEADYKTQVESLLKSQPMPKNQTTPPSLSQQVATGFKAFLGGSAQRAGYERNLEIVNKQGYVSFKNQHAIETMRNEPIYKDWTESVQPDGSVHFTPPANVKSWDELAGQQETSASVEAPTIPTTTRPAFGGVDNQTPSGILPGTTVDPYAGTWIAGNDSLADKIKKGQVGLGQTIQNVKTQFVSDVQPFYDIEKKISELDNASTINMLPDGTVSEADSLHKGLRGVRRAVKAAMHSIDQTYKPILEKLEKAGISRVQFDEYVSAVHFKDIMDSNEGILRRKGDILGTELPDVQHKILTTTDKKTLAQLEKDEKRLLKELSTLEPYELPASATQQKVEAVLKQWETNKTMKDLQQDFVNEQHNDLQMLVKAGRFTQKEVDDMIRKHPNYIDMGRKHDDFEPSLSITKMRGLGSDKDILNPFDSAILNRVVSYQTAAENIAKQKIVKLAKVKGADKFFKELDPATATEDNYKNSVKFYVNGEEKVYELSPSLMNAYTNLKSNQADDMLDKVLGGVNNLIRKGATGYNIDFIIKSIIRDSQAPLLTSRTGMGPHDLVLGFLDSFMGDALTKMTGGKFKSYRDVYKDMGGESSGLITMDYDSVHKMTKAMKFGASGLGKGLTLVNPFTHIEKLGAAIEHAPKLAEFRSAKRKGYSDADAMFQAVDVFDYSNAGTVGRKLNKKVTFFNAAIQGNARLLEAAKKNPGQFVAKGAMYITLPTVGIYSMRFAPGVSDEQRNRLRDMPEWKRNLAWHVPLPDGDTILSIPKGHVVAQLFANPVERVLDHLYDNSNKSWEEIGVDTGKDTLKSFMPPTGIAGVSQAIALATNYDMFMDMPLEDSAMQQQKPEDRHNMFTSQAAKGLANIPPDFAPEWTRSPAKIDYLLKSLTGGLGRDVLDTMDNFLAQDGSRPAKVNSTTQILNPLDQFVDDKTQGSGVYDRLYDVKDNNEDTEGYYNSIYELNKIIKDIREAKEMTSKEKRTEIEKIRKEQHRIANNALRNGVLQNK